jgi:hypothetical protein
MFLCSLAWPNPDLRRPMMLTRIRRQSPRSNSGFVSAKQVRSPLIAFHGGADFRWDPLGSL